MASRVWRLSVGMALVVARFSFAASSPAPVHVCIFDTTKVFDAYVVRSTGIKVQMVNALKVSFSGGSEIFSSRDAEMRTSWTDGTDGGGLAFASGPFAGLPEPYPDFVAKLRKNDRGWFEDNIFPRYSVTVAADGATASLNEISALQQKTLLTLKGKCVPCTGAEDYCTGN